MNECCTHTQVIFRRETGNAADDAYSRKMRALQRRNAYVQRTLRGVLCSTDSSTHRSEKFLGRLRRLWPLCSEAPILIWLACEKEHQVADALPDGICPQTAGAKVPRYWRWSARLLNIGTGAIHPWRRGASKHCGRASLFG